ncbi:hypothetical protein HDU99_004462, partial [Rhizoclosmatium hyalinum]
MSQLSMLAVMADLPFLLADLQWSAPDMLSPNPAKQAEAFKHIAKSLKTVLDIVRKVTETFELITMHEGTSDHVSSLFFGRMFASTAILAPFVRNPETGQYDKARTASGHGILTPGPGGQASPFFCLMDYFLNRKSYNTHLGHHTDLHLNSYPADWRNFLKALRSPHINGFYHFDEYLRVLDATIPAHFQVLDLFNSILESYAGESGFLGRHLLKLHGYLTGMFRTGREGTIGDAKAGSVLNRTEDMLYSMIETSRLERFEYMLPMFGRSADVRLIDEVGSGSGVWNIQLEAPLRCHDNPHSGGHIMVTPKNVELPLLERLTSIAGTNQIVQKLCQSVEWKRHLEMRRAEGTLQSILTFGDCRALLEKAQESDEILLKFLSKVVPLRPRTYSLARATPRLSMVIRKQEHGVAYKMFQEMSQNVLGSVPVAFPTTPLRLLPDVFSPGLPPLVIFAAGTGISPFADIIGDYRGSRDILFVWLSNTCRTQADSLGARLGNTARGLGGSNFQSLVVCTARHHEPVVTESDVRFEQFHVRDSSRIGRMERVFNEARSCNIHRLRELNARGCDYR